MATTTAPADRVEHTAPGEEQVVFSRKAGVVASKISYVGVLDPSNDWQVLESPHEDEAPALACQFNHLGTHFMVGDEGGRIDLWSLVPLRLFVKSLDLTPSFLNTLLPLPPFTEYANGSSPPAGTGTGKEKRRHGQEHGWSTPSVYWSRCSRYVVAAYVQKKKTWPDGEEVQLPGMVLLWNVVEAQVEGYLRLRSRVAHVSLSPMDPRRGSACCVDGTSFLFDFPPVVPRFLSKKEGHSQGSAEIAAVDAAKTFASIGAISDGDGCANILSSTASAEMGTPFAGREQQRQQQPIRGRAQSQPSNQRTGEGLVHGVKVKLPATPPSCLTSASSITWPEEKYAFIKGRDPEEKANNLFGSSDAIDVGTGAGEWVGTRVGEAAAREMIRLSCSGCGDGGSGSNDSGRSHGDDQGITAASEVTLEEEEIGKLVTPRPAEVGGGGAVVDSRQAGTEDLSEHRAGFADIMGDGGDDTWTCGISGRGCGNSSDVNMNSTVSTQRARTVKIWDPVQQLQLFSAVTSTATGKCSGTDEKTVIEPTAGTAGVGAGFPPGSGSGGVSGGGGSGSKPQSRTPVQPGRAAWCEDGETLFLLTHEGNLVKIKASANGDLSLLAIANLHGGASPATLQLTPEGDKLLVATATKGLCLVPSNDLDLSKAEMFGETFGMRGSKTRFWGAAVLGDVHGSGADGSGKRSLTIIGNPSRSRDEKTDLFFFDPNGGQPERVDTPRREGVICLACSSLRPLLVFICPTGELYFREEVLKTDFPGPWYPSGYVLIDNNLDYLEAEDQLDTVVMTGPNGEELSKTQAHEIVVPWQHQAVSEEEASTGTRDEPVDIDRGGNTDVWAKADAAELRWIPQDDNTWRSLGGEAEGSGCPGGSSRGGVQESCGGTLARLLGATPSILNESKKRFRAATASEADAAVKRRKMVPKMMEILAAKKKKYDEEVFKRKRKLQESRAKAKHLKDKKAAAASAEKAALQVASEEAEREETALNEEAALRANANATATGQGAADDAAADVYGVVVNGKDTARELRPLLAKRGGGGASKRRDVAACDSLPFGSAGSAGGNLDPHGYHLSAAPAHDVGAPEYTPCFGSMSLVGPDVWCPPGGGNDTGVGSLALTGGATAYFTPWVPVASMAGKYQQGAAAYAAPTGASIDGNCNRSSLSTKRPGEMLWKPPASHARLSVSTSSSFSNLSGHLAFKTNRHNGGDHGASSGTSGRRGAASAAQEYCGPASLQAEYAPASIDAPVCPQAAGVMYGLTTSQAGEAGRRRDKLVGTKGGCTAATTEVPLFANAREGASGGVSPFGGNASDCQRIPGEHGVCGVLDSGGLKHEPHSSLFPTDSPTDSRGGDYESLDVGSGRQVAPSRAMHAVGSALSSFSPLSSSDRRILSSGASCSTPLSRESSHRHYCSSQSSCLHHFSSPSLGNQRLKTPSPPILLPHTFRGVSASTEALSSGRSVPPPTSSASSSERMRHIIAEIAVLPVGSAGVSATPHNSWNRDSRRSMPRGVNEGGEARRPRPGFKLLENVVSPQKDESQRASDDGSQGFPSLDM